MRISDWSSDVCSSDLFDPCRKSHPPLLEIARHRPLLRFRFETRMAAKMRTDKPVSSIRGRPASSAFRAAGYIPRYRRERAGIYDRSEEHTSELQSLMRISYAVFCLKQKNRQVIHSH